jgi:methyl-accepting chemotaxis protein
MNLIENHNERVKYNFLYADQSWDIITFLNLVELQHVRWIEQLENAVESTAEFTGQTDPTKCFFGKWFYAYEVDDPVLNNILKKLEPEHVALHNSAKNINAFNGGNQKEEIYNSDVIPLGENIKTIFIEMHGYVDQKYNGLIESERANMAALDEASSQTELVLEDLETMADEEMVVAMEQADKAQQQGFMFLIITIIAGVVLAVVIGIFLSKGIMKQIGGEPRFIVSITEKVANGDLTVNLSSGNKSATGVTAAVKKMVGNLRNMVQQILDGSSEIASSSEEMSASAQQLSEGAQSQASTLEETSAAVEELSASVEQVSDHAQAQTSAVEQSISNMGQVQSSIDEVSKTLDSVSKIAKESVEKSKSGAETVKKAVDAINLISASSEEIAGIINVISDIADQTNLLALNASIEAARAGEHGRGFAVVADEVSKLADRSASSTKEIETLIKDTVKNVKEGVELAQGSSTSMEEITEGAQKSSDMIDDLAAALEQQVNAVKELSGAVENINEMSQSISAATEEQTNNSKQTSKAIEDVNEITQQAASAAEEMAASTEELSGMAQQLQSLVSQFKLDDTNKGQSSMALPEPGKDGTAEVKGGSVQEVTGITLKEEAA